MKERIEKILEALEGLTNEKADELLHTIKESIEHRRQEYIDALPLLCDKERIMKDLSFLER